MRKVLIVTTSAICECTDDASSYMGGEVRRERQGMMTQWNSQCPVADWSPMDLPGLPFYIPLFISVGVALRVLDAGC